MLKIGIVGVGYWSTQVHGPALSHYAKEHPGELDLAAVCVRKSVDKAKEFCQKFGFRRVVTSLDQMIDEDKLDACWVVSPIEGTRQIVGHLMERRIPVIFEKPPGKNLQEAKELAEISVRTCTPNMVAFNRRWAPCTRKALQWAAEHGPFEYLYARMLRAKRMDEQFAFGTGIHLLDCVRVLAEDSLGGIKSAATTKLQAASGIFNFHVDLHFGSGASGRCDILPTCGVVEETYTLFGRDRWITYALPWHEGDGKAELWVEGKLVDSEGWPVNPPFLSGGVYGEASEFIAALNNGRKPHPAAEDAVPSVALAEAVQKGENISFA
jgi:predicted dehydrogenase